MRNMRKMTALCHCPQCVLVVKHIPGILEQCSEIDSGNGESHSRHTHTHLESWAGTGEVSRSVSWPHRIREVCTGKEEPGVGCQGEHKEGRSLEH